MIFYTNRLVPTGFAAITLGPLIFIRSKYRDDVGLRRHEETHRAQCYRSFGLAPLLYLVSKKHRLAQEVEAYRVQLQYSPGCEALFASFLATKYRLNISVSQATALLRGGK